MIACKDKPLLREEDEILNSHRSIFICKAEQRSVTGNHKVLDDWKQLKGFMCCMANHLHAHVGLCFRAALVYSFSSTVLEFFPSCCWPPANMLTRSLTGERGGWSLFMVQFFKRMSEWRIQGLTGSVKPCILHSEMSMFSWLMSPYLQIIHRTSNFQSWEYYILGMNEDFQPLTE